jgi:hypothetical protein
MRTVVASDSPFSPGFRIGEAVKVKRTGSGVGHGEGEGGGAAGGGGSWAHAERIATTEANTTDFNKEFFIALRPAACQHQVSQATPATACRQAIEMETLRGFPSLPAMVRAEQSSAAPHADADLATGRQNLVSQGP